MREARILAGLRLLLERCDVLLVILDHLIHVGLVELGAQLLHHVEFLLGIMRKLLRQLDRFLFRDRNQLLVRLPVVLDHALTELCHLLVLGLLLRQLTKLDLP